MRVEEGQNIFDVTLKLYGSIDNVFDLLTQNKLDFNSKLQGGQMINVSNDGVGNEDIKSFFKNINPKNNQTIQLPPIVGGSYNGDYSLAYS
jgi:hypothetical protein